MSDYGIKIKNYQAGSIYEVNLGIRTSYDVKDAMLTNSQFQDYMQLSSRDIVCIEFSYGSRSFKKDLAHQLKMAKQNRIDRAIAKSFRNKYMTQLAEERKVALQNLYSTIHANEDKYVQLSADEIRTLFYANGVDIKWGDEVIHYKMLYRSPGKAKKGSCMFIREELYAKAHNYLWMGIEDTNQIVEIGAYSSLITSTIENRIKIEPENILILEDLDSLFQTNVISIETDDFKQCIAIPKENYTLKNTMFDGQALIDSSIFPEYGNGYILLRQHFCKMAAFNSNIQLFFRDYFGESYETATVTDLWGNEHLAKDIKLITTTNAMKWLKFNLSYEYWCKWVHENGCLFGVVKTAHESKIGGNMQRMSYQMVNALSEDIMGDVLSQSKEYIWKLKTDDDVFFEYLRKNDNFSNDYKVLLELCERNSDFVRSDYFRERRKIIIANYLYELKNGHIIQNAENLVIVGSPYGMLLHSVGEDGLSDPTFEHEDGTIQCWTERYADGEYLAEFRNPFNSKSNLGYLHNHHHEYFDRYFNLGRLIIAINMVGTDFQDRNNGSDQDSDSLYVTNQPNIVAHARKCYKENLTIVNNIPKDSNHYSNTPESFALIDNKLAAAQREIGESSNLAQICLTYTYNFDDQKYQDYVSILSVLAQAAIDSAKRAFDVDIGEEIKRIKKDINLRETKYPEFWLAVKKDFSKTNINRSLKCPMNAVYNLAVPSCRPKESTLPLSDFFVKHEFKGSKHLARKVQEWVQTYSIELFKYNATNENSEEYFILRQDFEYLVEGIRKLKLTNKYLPVMSWLLDRSFAITPNVKNKAVTTLNKNRSLLLRVLYEVNPEALLSCFKEK